VFIEYSLVEEIKVGRSKAKMKCGKDCDKDRYVFKLVHPVGWTKDKVDKVMALWIAQGDKTREFVRVEMDDLYRSETCFVEMKK